jgi:hypothetical protein
MLPVSLMRPQRLAAAQNNSGRPFEELGRLDKSQPCLIETIQREVVIQFVDPAARREQAEPALREHDALSVHQAAGGGMQRPGRALRFGRGGTGYLSVWGHSPWRRALRRIQT